MRRAAEEMKRQADKLISARQQLNRLIFKKQITCTK